MSAWVTACNFVFDKLPIGFGLPVFSHIPHKPIHSVILQQQGCFVYKNNNNADVENT